MNTSNIVLNSHNLLEHIFKISSEENPTEFLKYLSVCKRWNEIGQRILGKLWIELKKCTSENCELKNIVAYINLVEEEKHCFNKNILNSTKFKILAGILYNFSNKFYRKIKVTLCLEELKVIGLCRTQCKALELIWKNNFCQEWLFEKSNQLEVNARAQKIENYILLDKYQKWKIMDTIELNNIKLTVFPYCILNSCKNLKTIRCENTMLGEFPSVELPQLTYLSLKNNQIVEIDLTGFPLLETFHMGNNLLQKIDLAKNSQIKILTLNNNKITEIDLNPLVSLKHANLKQNPLDLEKFDPNSYGSIVLYDKPKDGNPSVFF